MNSLPPPLDALNNIDTRQIISAWYYNEGVSTAFDHGWAREDPSEWGAVLAYIARDSADSYRGQVYPSPSQVLGRIREAFEAEIRRQ